MKKDTFDVFCPQCNVVVEVKAIADATGEFQSEALNPEEQVDAMYDAEHYSICVCHRCNQAFLIQESLRGVPAEFEAVTDSVVLYPAESKISTEHFPLSIKSAYVQALRSYKMSLFDSSALMCRKCLYSGPHRQDKYSLKLR